MRIGVNAGTGRWLRDRASGVSHALGVLLGVALLADCNADIVDVDRGHVALVIGNATYESSTIGSLNNPVRDAEAVAEGLRDAGFEVTVKKDLQKSAFLESLSAFREASRRAEVAAFYYAGHGMEQEDVNYLIPVDMQQANVGNSRERIHPVGEKRANKWGSHEMAGNRVGMDGGLVCGVSVGAGGGSARSSQRLESGAAGWRLEPRCEVRAVRESRRRGARHRRERPRLSFGQDRVTLAPRDADGWRLEGYRRTHELSDIARSDSGGLG